MRHLALIALLGSISPAALAAGNGQSGNMFAVTTLSDLQVTGFQLYLRTIDSGLSCDWEVYTASADYTSIYDDETQWTLVDSGSVTATTTSDELVDISLTTPVSLSASTTTSFYVTVTDDPYCTLNYTDGSSQGTTYASDSNLEVDEGYGMAYPFIGYFSPRIFNGAVYYRTCEDGYLDNDGDGFGDGATFDCHYEGEIVADNTDCDDDDGAVYPGATEVWYDGIDADCAEDNDYDADGDTHESDAHGGDDCDDEAPEISPSATEIWYDGIDSDCGEDNDYDADADGHESADHEGDDCNDADGSISPSAAEVWYDGIDADCAGDDDYDADADGYQSDAHDGEDCDDANPEAYPTAPETWYDGVDADCAGDSDYDADMDGADAEEHGGEDCDDTTPDIGPEVTEIPDDGVDQDCDGEDEVTGGEDGSDGTDGTEGGDGSGDGGDGTDGTEGGDGSGDGGDAAGGDDGSGGGKTSCSSASSRPSGLLWLVGALGLVGLVRRRKG